MRRSLAILLLAQLVAACDGSPPAPKVTAPETAPAPAPAVSAPGAAAEARQGAVDKSMAADSALAAKVRSAIAAAPGLNAPAIDVVAKEGRISLFGTAATERQRRDTEKAAAAVAGVASVDNQIKIVSGS